MYLAVLRYSHVGFAVVSGRGIYSCVWGNCCL